MAAKTDKQKDKPAEDCGTCPPPPTGKKPSADMVARIACALLKSPGYALATREEQHLDRLVTNSVKIATKIITALEA